MHCCPPTNCSHCDRINFGGRLIHECKLHVPALLLTVYTSSLDSIHQLVGQKWVDVIGMMSTGRRRCLVANESSEKIFIVGGVLEDSVEECTVFDAAAFISYR